MASFNKFRASWQGTRARHRLALSSAPGSKRGWSPDDCSSMPAWAPRSVLICSHGGEQMRPGLREGQCSPASHSQEVAGARPTFWDGVRNPSPSWHCREGQGTGPPGDDAPAADPSSRRTSIKLNYHQRTSNLSGKKASSRKCRNEGISRLWGQGWWSGGRSSKFLKSSIS